MWRLRPETDFPATGGTVSYRGHGGHRELAFHVLEWRVHMPRSAWRCHMTNFSNSSAGISPLYPAALKRSADDWRIAPDRLEYNWGATVSHNVDEVVEKNARRASKMRRAKVRASSAGIMQERRQASVPGDGASSFFGGCGKSRYRVMKLSHARLRYPDTRLSETSAPPRPRRCGRPPARLCPSSA